jgi:two-component system CheB/CheR fusion protein
MDETNKPPAPRGLRILMVEDNVDTAETAALALRLHGHEVRTAPNGPTALHMVQEQMPDVVLLDIGLPQMNGWELARRLRELTSRADKPPWLIAVTGYHGSDYERCSTEAGMDLHLVKPVDLEELQRLLSSLRSLIDSD